MDTIAKVKIDHKLQTGEKITFEEFIEYIDGREVLRDIIRQVNPPQFIKNPTFDVCMKAIRRDMYLLQFVKEQTPDCKRTNPRNLSGSSERKWFCSPICERTNS